MAIGERIRFFRNMKGITQKYLGMVVGFPERSADVRMAQYETGSRTPKADLTKTLADFFDISPDALTVPDIDTDIGLMHTLFALEDIRGLTIGEIDGEVCLRLDKSKGKTYTNMLDMLSAWAEQAKKLEDLMHNTARLAFDEGYIFGEEGSCFERINAATPRANIEECMRRIKAAIDTL